MEPKKRIEVGWGRAEGVAVESGRLCWQRRNKGFAESMARDVAVSPWWVGTAVMLVSGHRVLLACPAEQAAGIRGLTGPSSP